MISPGGLQASAPRRCDCSPSNRVHGPMHVPITEKEAMKVSLKKPSRASRACAVGLCPSRSRGTVNWLTDAARPLWAEPLWWRMRATSTATPFSMLLQTSPC